MTERTNWSEGPWKVDSTGLVHDERDFTVANARYSNYLAEEEQEANAQLIATSPDLYRELEDAAEEFEALAKDARGTTRGVLFASTAARYRRLLARARGEVS